MEAWGRERTSCCAGPLERRGDLPGHGRGLPGVERLKRSQPAEARERIDMLSPPRVRQRKETSCSAARSRPTPKPGGLPRPSTTPRGGSGRQWRHLTYPTTSPRGRRHRPRKYYFLRLPWLHEFSSNAALPRLRACAVDGKGDCLDTQPAGVICFVWWRRPFSEPGGWSATEFLPGDQRSPDNIFWEISSLLQGRFLRSDWLSTSSTRHE